jgi:hypothetical protein
VLLFVGSREGTETWTWDDKSTWSKRLPATSPPFPGTGLAFNSSNKTAVLFGGLMPVGPRLLRLLDTTQLWDGSNWSVAPSGVRPPARIGESMVFDAARKNVVLFGGCRTFACTDALLNDTWTWDGESWRQESPLVAPSPRWGASMTFNPADNTIVLFGGKNSITHFLGDTWIWDGKDWKQQQPAASPSPRAAAGLAFHPALNGLLLFGGDSLKTTLDTWTWNGTTWKQLVGSDGPPVDPLAMVYDEAARLIFFVGIDGETMTTWTWGGPGLAAPGKHAAGAPVESSR